MQADKGSMAVLVEMHHTGKALRAEVVAAIEHMFADGAGDWRCVDCWFPGE